MNNKLYIGNLSWTTTDGLLQQAFSAYGTVTEATVMMDKFTGKSRGFAFVTMSTAEEAEAAARDMDNKEVDGRPVRVNIARPRVDYVPSGKPKKDFRKRISFPQIWGGLSPILGIKGSAEITCSDGAVHLRCRDCGRLAVPGTDRCYNCGG